MKPVGEISSTVTVWSIRYSQEVHRPRSDAYIRFYSNLTGEIVHQINVRLDFDHVHYSKNELTFSPTILWNIVSSSAIFMDLIIIISRVNGIIFYWTGQNPRKKRLKEIRRKMYF